MAEIDQGCHDLGVFDKVVLESGFTVTSRGQTRTADGGLKKYGRRR